MSRKVLVLGGAGFIGLRLVERLAADGVTDVTVCDDLSRGRLDREMEELLSSSPRLRFTNGDLTDASTFTAFEEIYDDVYLLAGVVGVRYTQERPDRVVYVNAMLVLRTLEWLREHATPPRLLYASTSETYAGSLRIMDPFPIPTPETVPVAIDDVPNPRFSYAAAKIMGEAAVMAYAQAHDVPAVVVRYHNVYGPRMGYEHVIPEVSLRLLRREEPFRIFGTDQSRAFCYVSDAVEGTVAAMSIASTRPEIVHIGNDREEIGIPDLLEKLMDLAGHRPARLETQPAPTGSPARRCPDISKARRLLGYEPRVDLDEGLRETFEWYRQRHPDGRIDRERATASRAH